MELPILTQEERDELEQLSAEVDRLAALPEGSDGMNMQLNYAEEALGAAMVRHRKVLLHTQLLGRSTNTRLDAAVLHKHCMTWLKKTRISRLVNEVGPGVDFYLKIVSEAAQLTYDETRERFRNGDPGLTEARIWVKNFMWALLYINPTSILDVHDATIVLDAGAVESPDASEELANRDG